MKRKLSLKKCFDLAYLFNRLSSLDYYVTRWKNNPTEIDNNILYWLDKINNSLNNNKKKIKWRNKISNLKTNLEIILAKENYDVDQVSYIYNLCQKEKITEEEILSFSKTFNNKDCEFIFRSLILKSFDIFTFDDKTIDIIKNYINDDKWVNNCLNFLGAKRAEELLNELNIVIENNITFSYILKDKFTELFNIMNMSFLNTKLIKDIIVTLKKYLEKIITIDDYEDNDLYQDLINLFNKIQNLLDLDPTSNITYKLINKELNLEIGKSYFSTIDYEDDNLPLYKKLSPIITLDDIVSPDLDSAFSIVKDNDLYLFNIYVTDTPSFLNKNRNLSINAYKQGTSFYIRDGDKNINYDMLPESLSHNYLSMLQSFNEVKPKNSICFQFVFKEDGTLEDCKVSRNKVVVDCNLFKDDAIRILNQKMPLTSIDKSIYLLQDLTKIVANSSDKKNFQWLKEGRVCDMIAFPSILVNYYLADQLELGIFYENGSYIKKPSTVPYLRAGAPLRRYADDINLAILLEQEGLYSFNKDDFKYLENNFDEIIEHLNEQNFLDKYIDKNNSLVRKYYLKRD